ALPLVGDARVALEELAAAVGKHRVASDYGRRVARLRDEWSRERERVCKPTGKAPATQAEIIGAVNEFTKATDVIVCAAGSLPGDLHKLWNARDPKQYHLEYGYSCMGYEIAGGLGVKLA